MKIRWAKPHKHIYPTGRSPAARTFQRAPNLLLPLLRASLRLLAGLAVQVLSAQAGLAAQLNRKETVQTLKDHSTSPPQDPGSKSPYHFEGHFHVSLELRLSPESSSPRFRSQPGSFTRQYGCRECPTLRWRKAEAVTKCDAIPQSVVARETNKP